MAKEKRKRSGDLSLVCEAIGVLLKILQVYYEPLLSGQTAHVLSLSTGLASRGHEVTVLLPLNLKKVSANYSAAGVEVVLLPMRKFFWPIKSMYLFIKQILFGNFDIVHIHSQEAGIIARCLAILGRANKIFYTPQTIDIRQQKWNNLYTHIESLLARFTDQIFSVNQADASRMINWGISTKKVSVIPNGVDFRHFDHLKDRLTICNMLGLKCEYPVVMQVGRLSPQKNPEMFLKGAKQVLGENPNVQFVWIGEGPSYNWIKSEVESLQLHEKIRIVGRIDQAFHCMVAADVVTSSSRWEGLPYAILEAMACSKPVVSTAVNGCSELVVHGQTGYLVDSGDATNWAKSILHLIANPQVAHLMGSSGRRLVEQKFSLSTMISKIEQAYHEF